MEKLAHTPETVYRVRGKPNNLMLGTQKFHMFACKHDLSVVDSSLQLFRKAADKCANERAGVNRMAAQLSPLTAENCVLDAGVCSWGSSPHAGQWAVCFLWRMRISPLGLNHTLKQFCQLPLDTCRAKGLRQEEQQDKRLLRSPTSLPHHHLDDSKTWRTSLWSINNIRNGSTVQATWWNASQNGVSSSQWSAERGCGFWDSDGTPNQKWR